MDDNLSNKEEVEIFKKWFKEYGVVIIVALALGLGLSYGWKYYKNYRQQASFNASMLFDRVTQLVAAKNYDAIAPLSKRLISDYASTPYAALSQMMLAKGYVQEKKYKQALESLQWVVLHGDQPGMKQIARLRVARIRLQQGRYKKALSALRVVNQKSFQPMIDEVHGDILRAQGNSKGANQWYQKAHAAFVSQGLNDLSLQLKVGS